MAFRKKKSNDGNVVGDWRTTIPQRVRAGGTSSAKQRRFSGWANTFIVCATTFGAVTLFAVVWAQMTGDASDDGFEPLRVVMKTDGILDEKWFHEWTGVDSGSRDVSIVKLRKKLESYGQVLSAEVSRERDRSLRVTLRERCAIGRIQLPGGGVKILAEDGVIFPADTYIGDGEKLPLVVDAKVENSPDGLERAVGVEPLLKFLALVRQDYPTMLIEWESVSVKGLPAEIFEGKPQPWAVIRVYPVPEPINPAFPRITEIVFSAQNFSEELALWGSQDTQEKLERHFTDEDRKNSYSVQFIVNRKNSHSPILESRIILNTGTLPTGTPRNENKTRGRR